MGVAGILLLLGFVLFAILMVKRLMPTLLALPLMAVWFLGRLFQNQHFKGHGNRCYRTQKKREGEAGWMPVPRSLHHQFVPKGVKF